MDQIIDFFKGLFRTDLWPARWHCGLWSDFHGWLYIISDLLIWSAYFAIPLIIIGYITRRKGTQFFSIYFLFAAFILACGTTHLLDAITFWYPMYRLNALVRFFTGIISWVTVFALVRMLPVAFALKSPELLEAEVEQRKKAEEELKQSLTQLNSAQEIARMGHWELDLKTQMVKWSPGLYKVYELPISADAMSCEESMIYMHPDDRPGIDEMINENIRTKAFKEYYYRIRLPKGHTKTLYIRGEVLKDAQGNASRVLGTTQDVTEQKHIELELQTQTNNLKAANAELQKFAYVASHDLQEPLRKINTFGSRLVDEYGASIPDKGKVYLEKMTGASVRMQKLISDILHFSQLTSSTLAFEKTDLNIALLQVLSDMEVTIDRTGARVTAAKLPVIEVNKTQIIQLFQNLLSNSIKFGKPDVTPVISIAAEIINGEKLGADHPIKGRYKFSGWNEDRYWKSEKFCKLTIKDNGIGFAPEHADKIFVVFQRLDASAAMEGTGIGLAICKKIIDNHHGTIQADGVPGDGATFTIILPVSQGHFE